MIQLKRLRRWRVVKHLMVRTGFLRAEVEAAVDKWGECGGELVLHVAKAANLELVDAGSFVFDRFELARSWFRESGVDTARFLAALDDWQASRP